MEKYVSFIKQHLASIGTLNILKHPSRILILAYPQERSRVIPVIHVFQVESRWFKVMKICEKHFTEAWQTTVEKH